MNINPAYIVLAVTIAAVWVLRRIGMDESTADAIVTALILGLGASPSVAVPGLPKPKPVPPPVEAQKTEGP